MPSTVQTALTTTMITMVHPAVKIYDFRISQTDINASCTGCHGTHTISSSQLARYRNWKSTAPVLKIRVQNPFRPEISSPFMPS